MPTIQKRYQLEKIIRTGTTNKVRLAWDKLHQKEVAIKLVSIIFKVSFLYHQIQLTKATPGKSKYTNTCVSLKSQMDFLVSLATGHTRDKIRLS